MVKKLTKDKRILQLEKQILKNAQKHLKDIKELLPYQAFYDHIKEHLFKSDHVCCKICNKTFEQIVKEYQDKGVTHGKA